MSEICEHLRYPASFVANGDNGPDVSLDEELIEILASLDCGKTRLQPAFR